MSSTSSQNINLLITSYYDLETAALDPQFCSFGAVLDIYVNGTLTSLKPTFVPSATTLKAIVTVHSSVTVPTKSALFVIVRDNRNPNDVSVTTSIINVFLNWCSTP